MNRIEKAFLCILLLALTYLGFKPEVRKPASARAPNAVQEIQPPLPLTRAPLHREIASVVAPSMAPSNPEETESETRYEVDHEHEMENGYVEEGVSLEEEHRLSRE